LLQEAYSNKTYAHSTDSEFFEKWFTACLLKKVPKGHAIIMGNAGFHRKGELESLAETAGVALLFLPAYSPDFNPIEHSWANMKRWLRDNESRFPALDSAIYHFFQCKGI
jgi:transposase